MLGTANDKIWPGFSQLPNARKVNFAIQPYNNLRQKFPNLTEIGFDLLNKMLTYHLYAQLFHSSQPFSHLKFLDTIHPSGSQQLKHYVIHSFQKVPLPSRPRSCQHGRPFTREAPAQAHAKSHADHQRISMMRCNETTETKKPTTRMTGKRGALSY